MPFVIHLGIAQKLQHLGTSKLVRYLNKYFHFLKIEKLAPNARNFIAKAIKLGSIWIKCSL